MNERHKRKHYDSPDNNAWTRANYGLPPQPGDPGYGEQEESKRMSEQQKQEKRREWVVGRRDSYTTGWPIYEDGALVTLLASTPREATARQIVDDHNRIPLLEAELDAWHEMWASLKQANDILSTTAQQEEGKEDESDIRPTGGEGESIYHP